MNWEQLLKEAIHYLQEYIRIDTVNPPGNEIEGARFFKKIFDTESIPCQLFRTLSRPRQLSRHAKREWEKETDPSPQSYGCCTRGKESLGG